METRERERLIAQYAAGPARLRGAWQRVPPAARRWRPAEGEWSAHEVVVHAADSEANSYGRIRMLVSEREPLIVGYDQERWARTFDYHRRPPALALAVVQAVRASTAELLRQPPESAWALGGRHTESGPYTAEDWLRIYAEHLEGHARQIETNLAAWRAAHPAAGRAPSRRRAGPRPRRRAARTPRGGRRRRPPG
jgi:hypothetical protein